VLPLLRATARDMRVTMRRGDAVIDLSIDDDGYIVARGTATEDEHRSAAAAWTHGMDISTRIRHAVAAVNAEVA